MINLASGGKSFQSYCAEQGVDWRDRIDEMKEAQEYAQKQGVTLSFVQKISHDDGDDDSDNSDKKENHDMNGGDKEDEKEN